MGKKNKKSFYGKQLRPFIKNNRVFLAALGGAAAGITIANILGTQKAQEILHTVEDSVSNFTQKVARDLEVNTAKESLEKRESPEKKEDRRRKDQAVEA